MWCCTFSVPLFACWRLTSLRWDNELLDYWLLSLVQSWSSGLIRFAWKHTSSKLYCHLLVCSRFCKLQIMLMLFFFILIMTNRLNGCVCCVESLFLHPLYMLFLLDWKVFCLYSCQPLTTVQTEQIKSTTQMNIKMLKESRLHTDQTRITVLILSSHLVVSPYVLQGATTAFTWDQLHLQNNPVQFIACGRNSERRLLRIMPLYYSSGLESIFSTTVIFRWPKHGTVKEINGDAVPLMSYYWWLYVNANSGTMNLAVLNLLLRASSVTEIWILPNQLEFTTVKSDIA